MSFKPIQLKLSVVGIFIPFHISYFVIFLFSQNKIILDFKKLLARGRCSRTLSSAFGTSLWLNLIIHHIVS
jgi:hypothetical protein